LHGEGFYALLCFKYGVVRSKFRKPTTFAEAWSKARGGHATWRELAEAELPDLLQDDCAGVYFMQQVVEKVSPQKLRWCFSILCMHLGWGWAEFVKHAAHLRRDHMVRRFAAAEKVHGAHDPAVMRILTEDATRAAVMDMQKIFVGNGKDLGAVHDRFAALLRDSKGVWDRSTADTELKRLKLPTRKDLNPEQRALFDQAAADLRGEVQPEGGGVSFFLEAATPGARDETHLFAWLAKAGSGKSYLCNALLREFCGGVSKSASGTEERRPLLEAAASTGLAASGLFLGRTIHKTWGITVPDEGEAVETSILPGTKRWNHLKEVDGWVVDEAWMQDWKNLECANKLLQQVMGSAAPFGGKTMILVGHDAQLPPVAPTEPEIVRRSIKCAPWLAGARWGCISISERHKDDPDWAKFLDRLAINSGELRRNGEGEVLLPSTVQSYTGTTAKRDDRVSVQMANAKKEDLVEPLDWLFGDCGKG
jgi:hypothetical protein